MSACRQWVGARDSETLTDVGEIGTAPRRPSALNPVGGGLVDGGPIRLRNFVLSVTNRTCRRHDY